MGVEWPWVRVPPPRPMFFKRENKYLWSSTGDPGEHDIRFRFLFDKDRMFQELEKKFISDKIMLKYPFEIKDEREEKLFNTGFKEGVIEALKSVY